MGVGSTCLENQLEFTVLFAPLILDPMNKAYGYSRVSTSKQCVDSQFTLFHDADRDEIFIEVQSGGATVSDPNSKNCSRLFETEIPLSWSSWTIFLEPCKNCLPIAREIEQKGAHLQNDRSELSQTRGRSITPSLYLDRNIRNRTCLTTKGLIASHYLLAGSSCYVIDINTPLLCCIPCE